MVTPKLEPELSLAASLGGCDIIASIMDAVQWRSSQLAPSIPAKRSWNGWSASQPLLNSLPGFRESFISSNVGSSEPLSTRAPQPSEATTEQVSSSKSSLQTEDWLLGQSAWASNSSDHNRENKNAQRTSSNVKDGNASSVHKQPPVEPRDLWKRQRHDSVGYHNGRISPTRDPSTKPGRQSSPGSAVSDGSLPLQIDLQQAAPEGPGFRLPPINPLQVPGKREGSQPTGTHSSPPLYNTQASPSTQFPSLTPTNTILQPSQHPPSPALSSSLNSGIASATSPAVAAHVAALQNELATKAYALQTLQQEHDKLLAALSRSQKRVKAAEEKQNVAEAEANSLADERARLTDRVSELEIEVAEVSKARDEARDMAVKEGRQYMEIIQRSTQLELKAAEERKQLKTALAEKEKHMGEEAARNNKECWCHTEGSTKSLEEDVQHLRTKCAAFEKALEHLRYDSRRIGESLLRMGSASGVEGGI